MYFQFIKYCVSPCFRSPRVNLSEIKKKRTAIEPTPQQISHLLILGPGWNSYNVLSIFAQRLSMPSVYGRVTEGFQFADGKTKALTSDETHQITNGWYDYYLIIVWNLTYIDFQCMFTLIQNSENELKNKIGQNLQVRFPDIH
jgi:hypothetical protein